MPYLLYERHPAGHYATFTMNRPDRLNAQGTVMRQELESVLAEFTNDPEMRVGSRESLLSRGRPAGDVRKKHRRRWLGESSQSG